MSVNGAPNKYRGKCECCSTTVQSGAGTVHQNAAGVWKVRCVPCAAAALWQVVSVAADTDTPEQAAATLVDGLKGIGAA